MIDIIKDLVKKYPSDADLGHEVRKLVQECKHCHSYFIGTVETDYCPSCYV